MAFAPDSATAGHSFGPDYALETMTLADERLRPQTIMPRETIDVFVRYHLSSMGMVNAQQVTAQSHPELYRAWVGLSQRAGHGDRIPQLIIAESEIANELEITDGPMVLTTSLLSSLSLREVVGVLAHEQGHRRYKGTGTIRRTAEALFGGAGLLLGNFIGKAGGAGKLLEPLATKFERFGTVGTAIKSFLMPGLGTPNGIRPASLLGYVAYLFIGVTAGKIAGNQISVRPSELQADLEGVALSGDAEAMASGFLKMEAADTRGPIKKFIDYLRSGYPTTDERVANIRRAAKEMPFNPLPGMMDVPAVGPQPTIRGGVENATRLQPETAMQSAR